MKELALPSLYRERSLRNLLLFSCVGFALQGFGSGVATQVASVRNCQQLPQSLTEQMTANCKVDPLLAKAKPISDSGSTSVITY